MSRRYRAPALAAGVLGALALAAPGDARACGGCFAPPPPTPEAVQVVTDHRMVFALSEQQTTLWDQIRYAGSPENFVWVLPVADASRLQVGLGDDAFVEALDQATAPTVTGTLPSCPSGYRYGSVGGSTTYGGCGGAGGAPSSYGADGGTPGAGSESTTISHAGEAIVGPYAIEVVSAAAGDMALGRWLEAHGFAVPAATRAAIDFYVRLQFDFLVVHLAPGAGVQQMQPIRITTRGYSPVLPLRMIAAGVAEKVGLTLMVVANTRVRTQNFADVMIPERALVYDYASRHSNWSEVWEVAARGHGAHSAWVTESVIPMTEGGLTYAPGAAYRGGDAGAGRDGGALSDAAPLADAAFGEAGSAMFADGFMGDADDAGALREDANGDDAAAQWDDGALVDDTTFGDDAAAQWDDAAAGDDGGEAMDAVGADAAGAPDAGTSTPSDPFVDRRFAFVGMGDNAVITRMRTSLAPSELDTDLFLESSDEGLLPPQYVAGRVTNGPECNPDNACAVVGGGAPVFLEAVAVVVLVSRWRRRKARRAAAR